jgi:hypothetical protein
MMQGKYRTILKTSRTLRFSIFFCSFQIIYLGFGGCFSTEQGRLRSEGSLLRSESENDWGKKDNGSELHGVSAMDSGTLISRLQLNNDTGN